MDVPEGIKPVAVLIGIGAVAKHQRIVVSEPDVPDQALCIGYYCGIIGIQIGPFNIDASLFFIVLRLNGLYKYFIIIFIFLLIVLIGAGGTIKGQIIIRLYKFFGDISYPMYITYYPLIYIYNAWAANNKVPLQKAYPFSILLLIAAILIANASLKLYDEPVRKWLKNSVLKNN